MPQDNSLLWEVIAHQQRRAQRYEGFKTGRVAEALMDLTLRLHEEGKLETERNFLIAAQRWRELNALRGVSRHWAEQLPDEYDATTDSTPGPAQTAEARDEVARLKRLVSGEDWAFLMVVVEEGQRGAAVRLGLPWWAVNYRYQRIRKRLGVRPAKPPATAVEVGEAGDLPGAFFLRPPVAEPTRESSPTPDQPSVPASGRLQS